jgi:HAD superfamily hydrolase (TIGR01549 family)
MAPSTPRRFAPLKSAGEHEAASAPSSASKLAGIVFDMDGTLVESQTWMFSEMRRVLGITKKEDILDHIYSLPSENGVQEKAMESIRAVERSAMTQQTPQPGLSELMAYLTSRGIRKSICTRNFDMPVNHMLTNFLAGHELHPVITREFRPPKPSPEGILHIAKTWALSGADELIMVGDSMDDMQAGRSAGAATVLLAHEESNKDIWEDERVDLVIQRLDDLIEVLEKGFEGRKAG